MIKLLIGGSPCTHWSIAQTSDRETKAEGLGWELFENYLFAKEEFKPDFFLYENNKSAALPIKEQISNELGVDLMHINSALVSAQDRQRFYAFNWEVKQPVDRGILLRDILKVSSYGSTSQTRCADKPVKVGEIGKGGQGNRIYSVNGKSVTLCAASGGIGSNTGLYAIPAKDLISGVTYEVKNGMLDYKGLQCPVKLNDGYYEIRKLSVTEACRLQTLPDDYCRAVSPTQAYRGLGNGWTAEIIIWLLNGALKDVPRDEKIVVLSMYDGIGTGRYCLDKMGFTNVTYYAYEIDEYAIKVATSNYPNIVERGNAFQFRERR